MEDNGISEKIPPSELLPQAQIEKSCRYCMKPIHINATACHHCRFHQSHFVQYYLSYGALAILLAFRFGIFQSCHACLEKIAASEAKRDAKIAIANANVASDKAKKAQCDLIQTGFQLIDVSNITYYYLSHRVALQNEWRCEIYGGIDTLRKKSSSRFMVFWASNERRPPPWELYGSLISKPARQRYLI